MTKNVVVFARFFEPAFRGGGPIQTMSAMLRNVPAGFCTWVIATNQDLGDASPLPVPADTWTDRGFAKVRYVPGGVRPFAAAIRSSARRRKVSIVYLNSLFEIRFSLIPLLMRRLGCWRGARVVLAPRGELHPGALALKHTKKAIFLAVYRALGLHRGVLWHASNETEAEAIRDVFGSKAVIAVRENETTLAPVAEPREDRVSGNFRLLFASRAVPKKGLLTLLDALRHVTHPVELDVIGAFEESDYERLCQHAAEEVGENVIVNFLGAQSREYVIDAMRHADAFVLPTLGENFGHVIAESLSVGCPVLCSDTTPWSTVLENGGGRLLKVNEPPAWSRAINDFVAGGGIAWQEACESAREAYTKWRNLEQAPHVFELAIRHFGTSSEG